MHLVVWKGKQFGSCNWFQVSRAAVEGYTGEGEPPCIVMTLRATNKTVSIDANFTVTLNGVQPPNTITITRSPDAANFQMEASTDDDSRCSKSYADIGKLYGIRKLWNYAFASYRV